MLEGSARYYIQLGSARIKEKKKRESFRRTRLQSSILLEKFKRWPTISSFCKKHQWPGLP